MKNITIFLTLVKTTALLILLQGTALAYESHAARFFNQ